MSLLQLSVYLATVLPKITIPWKVLNCDRDYLLHRVVVRNGCQASFSKRSLSRSHAALYHSWKKKKPKMSENACDFSLEHKWCGAKRGNFQALFAHYGMWDGMNHLRDSEELSLQEFLLFAFHIENTQYSGGTTMKGHTSIPTFSGRSFHFTK